jgi:hypothetical protein
LALVPDRGKHKAYYIAAYILFLLNFFVVKSVKLLLVGLEMQVKNCGVKKKFSCYSKIALNVAVHKKIPRKRIHYTGLSTRGILS